VDAELVSLVSDIALGISAVVVAVVAFFGLRTWRKELTGKAKFDVARNVMLLGFKLRENFKWARNPGGWSWEYANRTRQENESPELSAVLDQWYAKNQRLQLLVENLQKLEEAAWEAEILLNEDSGKCVQEAFNTYRSSYAELSSAIYSYFETRHDEAIGQDVRQRQEEQKELKKEIYSAARDDFSKRIDQATEQLATALKTYVK